jgi:hypothetical protein
LGLSLNFKLQTKRFLATEDTEFFFLCALYSGHAGIFLRLTKRFSLDLRINASYCKVNPADIKINIGGTGFFLD